eukprot:1983993-Pleurochrysis_carterae.AAC.2
MAKRTARGDESTIHLLSSPRLRILRHTKRISHAVSSTAHKHRAIAAMPPPNTTGLSARSTLRPPRTVSRTSFLCLSSARISSSLSSSKRASTALSLSRSLSARASSAACPASWLRSAPITSACSCSCSVSDSFFRLSRESSRDESRCSRSNDSSKCSCGIDRDGRNQCKHWESLVREKTALIKKHQLDRHLKPWG